MMKDFNWNEFKKGKIAVHCPKRHLAEHFFSKCKENGIDKWRDGDNLTSKNYWDDDKDATCYYMYYGFVYSHIKVLNVSDYEIIEWKLNPTSKEDVEEIAKFMSSKEFINEFIGELWTLRSVDNSNLYYCGVRLKDIKFKGDIEEPIEQPIKKIKSYSISEMINDFKEDTEFKRVGIIYKINTGYLYFKNHKHEWVKSKMSIKDMLKVKFNLVKEPKKSYTLYQVEHKPNGKQYAFRCDRVLRPVTDNIFVKCDTSIGDQYGRVVCSIEIELTKAEYQKYKKIVRV